MTNLISGDLNKCFFAEEVQSVFKEEKYRRSDAATIFLLIEKIFDRAFEAIKNPSARKPLLQGIRKDFAPTNRNREIKEYILIQVHDSTAANFEMQCEETLNI